MNENLTFDEVTYILLGEKSSYISYKQWAQNEGMNVFTFQVFLKYLECMLGEKLNETQKHIAFYYFTKII